MNIPDRYIPLASKAKRTLQKFGGIFVKLFPNLFKGGTIQLSLDNAEKILLELHPDPISSSCTDNFIESNPKYDLHIIIPVYNVEKYINNCINSILTQKTFYSFFITVVNDGSTDNTGAILKEFDKFENIEIIEQSNQGYSGARNSALKHIKGNFVMFVDSDDLLEEDAIDALLNAGYNYNADIVQGGFNHFDDKGIFDKVKLKKQQTLNPEDIQIFSYPWAKIFRSHLFRHLRFPEGYWYEDTITKFILVPNSKMKVSIPQIVYNYRHHRDTVMKQSKDPFKGLDATYVTRSILKDCSKYYSIDGYLHEHFLHQAKWNFDRIKSINSESLKKSVFLIHKTLYEIYFKPMNKVSTRFPIMKKAFEEGDYQLYIIACLLYT